MGAVKIRAADRHFSLCIREAADWTCQRCGSKTPEDKRMGLHTSHYHGRGKWATRFDVLNVEALCYGCHSYLEQHPHEHEQRERQRLGDQVYEIVLERARDTRLGRLAKRNEKEISRHYRLEHKRLMDLRAAGHQGKLDVENWV